MVDPREHKLPKWAQELLRQERLQAVLRFPEAPRPEPDWSFDASGHDKFHRKMTPGAKIWQVQSGYGLPKIVFSVVGDDGRHIYSAPGRKRGFSRRPHGYYFASHADAVLALRWSIATMAAEALLDVEEGDD